MINSQNLLLLEKLTYIIVSWTQSDYEDWININLNLNLPLTLIHMVIDPPLAPKLFPTFLCPITKYPLPPSSPQLLCIGLNFIEMTPHIRGSNFFVKTMLFINVDKLIVLSLCIGWLSSCWFSDSLNYLLTHQCYIYRVLPFQNFGTWVSNNNFIFQNPFGQSFKSYWILAINIDSFFGRFSWLSRPLTQWDLL